VEFGVLDCDTSDNKGLPVTTQTMHVLSPDNYIALIHHYHLMVGRNWRELLCSIMALQLV
jgi:alkyl hydroperoxide reductase subunit AhpC